MPELVAPVEAIRAHLANWDTPYPDLAVFGTAEPELIAERVDTFCRDHLGASVAGYVFCTASQGVTHGVVLENGERVVVKVHQPPELNPERHSDVRALDSVHRALEHLHRHGFPCPRPLLRPTPLGRGLATVQELVQTGERGDGFRPAHRRALAASLVELVELLAPLTGKLPGLLFFLQPSDRLYPTPHSRLFDFEATSGGAEWIDALAERARDASLHSGPAVIGHADWRLEHVRFENDRVSASYDWESISPMSETQLVGLTASHHTTDWSSYAPGRVPTVDAVRAFIADYEDARGRPFSKSEHASMRAMSVYASAYGSRCQHALAPDTRPEDWPENSWPGLLRASAEAFLTR
jgi:hypothetical protein